MDHIFKSSREGLCQDILVSILSVIVCFFFRLSVYSGPNASQKFVNTIKYIELEILLNNIFPKIFIIFISDILVFENL